MDAARRAVRLDLGTISGPLARQILEQSASAVEAEVRRLRPALKHTQGLDADDLRSMGQIAALESYLTWDAAAGCALRTWTGKVIRWRLSEAIERAQSPERCSGSTPPKALEQTYDPSEGYDASERIGWLETTVGTLAPRLRCIVAAKLRGESGSEVGRTLGVSQTLISVELDRALGTLRLQAVDDGLGEV